MKYGIPRGVFSMLEAEREKQIKTLQSLKRIFYVKETKSAEV
jgi:hypothetical protein